jgi:hypothetical protein
VNKARVNDPDYVPGDALTEPYRIAAEKEPDGLVPQKKWPDGKDSIYCLCPTLEAPEDRPARLCPMHGWERKHQDFPRTDSADEAKATRRG